jgi:hypothetical protein
MDSACIFRLTLARCDFTVVSLMPSVTPMRLFDRPETTNVITYRSRSVSEA